MRECPRILCLAALKAVLPLLVAGFAYPVVAQRYWDINGATAGASSNNVAPGTWGVNNFWSTSSSGTAATTAWTAGQQAVFSAGANATGSFSVAVSGNQLASGIVFEEGSLTLNGGIITLTNGVGNATVNVASTNFATIASQIAGANGLIKSGTGTLLLSGTNSYSGSTDLQAGTLLVAKPSSIGNSSLDLDGGSFGASGAALVLNNAVTLSSDSTIAGSQNLTFTGNFNAEGGPRTLNISNPGTTTFAGSTLSLGDPNKQGLLTLNITGGDVSISGTIQNGLGTRPDGLIKTGNGNLLLSGNNTFTGNLQLNAGSLFLGSDSAAGRGSLVLADGTTLAAFNGPRTVTNNLTLNGNVTFAGSDSLTFLDAFNLGGNRTFTVLNTTLFNGVISGNYSLVKNGSGTLVLNAANTFGSSSTRLSVNAGTLALGNNSAAGRTANVLVLNGGAVQAYGAARSLANPLVLSNNSAISGNLNLTLSGVVSNLGGSHSLSISNSALTTLSGSTLTLAGPNSPASLTLDVAGSSGGLTISNLIQNGSGSGVGSLTKIGSGILTLGGANANSFSGGLTLNDGTLSAAKLNALGSGPLTVNNGTLNLNTYNQTVGAFTMANGTVNSSKASLSASSFLLYSGTLNASLAGSGALTKASSGSVTLSASNSFSGGSTLNAGSLWVNNTSGSGTGSGAVIVNNGASLGGSGSISGPITLNYGAILSPGAGVGSFITASETWNSGATLRVEMINAISGEGSGWDLLKITGSLSIVSSTGNPLFVDLRSLSPAGLPGPVSNFTNSIAYSWRLISTTAGITFSTGQNVQSAFSLLLNNFNNPTASGLFSLSLQNGNKDLVLSFTPAAVPEPSAWSMIAMGFLLLILKGKVFAGRR